MPATGLELVPTGLSWGQAYSWTPGPILPLQGHSPALRKGPCSDSGS